MSVKPIGFEIPGFAKPTNDFVTKRWKKRDKRTTVNIVINGMTMIIVISSVHQNININPT